jgi:hypothetical protein
MVISGNYNVGNKEGMIGDVNLPISPSPLLKLGRGSNPSTNVSPSGGAGGGSKIEAGGSSGGEKPGNVINPEVAKENFGDIEKKVPPEYKGIFNLSEAPKSDLPEKIDFEEKIENPVQENAPKYQDDDYKQAGKVIEEFKENPALTDKNHPDYPKYEKMREAVKQLVDTTLKFNPENVKDLDVKQQFNEQISKASQKVLVEFQNLNEAPPQNKPEDVSNKNFDNKPKGVRQEDVKHDEKGLRKEVPQSNVKQGDQQKVLDKKGVKQEGINPEGKKGHQQEDVKQESKQEGFKQESKQGGNQSPPQEGFQPGFGGKGGGGKEVLGEKGGDSQKSLDGEGLNKEGNQDVQQEGFKEGQLGKEVPDQEGIKGDQQKDVGPENVEYGEKGVHQEGKKDVQQEVDNNAGKPEDVKLGFGGKSGDGKEVIGGEGLQEQKPEDVQQQDLKHQKQQRQLSVNEIIRQWKPGGEKKVLGGEGVKKEGGKDVQQQKSPLKPPSQEGVDHQWKPSLSHEEILQQRIDAHPKLPRSEPVLGWGGFNVVKDLKFANLPGVLTSLDEKFLPWILKNCKPDPKSPTGVSFLDGKHLSFADVSALAA